MSRPSPVWEHNPYAPSPAALADPQPAAQQDLAPRTVRLMAHVIDALLLGATLLPLAIGFAVDMTRRVPPNYTVQGGALTLLAGGLWAGINLHLAGRNGQSIGKRLMAIKVVRRDGSPASLGRIFWLRNLVNALPLVIPVAGQLYALFDSLLIFTQTRQCLHDQIADTQVVHDRRGGPA